MPDGYAEFEDRMRDRGVDGRLFVDKDAAAGAAHTDPVSGGGGVGGALAAYDRDDWPPCRCGRVVCPDYAPPPAPAERLRAHVAEANRRSRRGPV